MKGPLRPGKYEVNVKVYDVIWKHEVVSTVTVVVKDIDDVAIANAGSLRIQGNIFQLSEPLRSAVLVDVFVSNAHILLLLILNRSTTFAQSPVQRELSKLLGEQSQNSRNFSVLSGSCCCRDVIVEMYTMPSLLLHWYIYIDLWPWKSVRRCLGARGIFFQGWAN